MLHPCAACAHQIVKSTSKLDMVPERYHRLLHLEAGPDFSLQQVNFASVHVGERIANLLAKHTKQQVWSLPGRLHDFDAFLRQSLRLMAANQCHLVLSHRLQLESFLDGLGEKSAWRSVKGVVFEQYCHQVGAQLHYTHNTHHSTIHTGCAGRHSRVSVASLTMLA